MNRLAPSFERCLVLLPSVFLLILYCSSTVKAQNPTASGTTGPSPSNEATSKGANPLQKERDFQDALNVFQHNFRGRFGRAFEYDLQRIEQPTVLFPSSGPAVPNPERYLNEHTLKFQFSELFPSSSTLADAVKNACHLLTEPNSTDEVADAKIERDSDTCVGTHLPLIVSGGGVWKRIAAGFTVNIDLSERSSLQQGVVLTSNTSFLNHYQVTGGFDFDPTQLFLGGTNWSSAFGAKKSAGAEVYDRCRPEPRKNHDESKDAKDAQDDIVARRAGCIDDLSSPRLLSKDQDNPEYCTIGRHHKPMLLLAAVVPTVSFKRMSQFDFAKNGGILVPAQYLEAAQNQVTFKWDLKKAIPSAASRTALMPKEKGQSSNSRNSTGGGKLCVIISGNVRSYINVSPAFPAESCANFAASTGARYQLGCVTDRGISIQSDHPSSAVADNESCWNAGLMAEENPR